MPETNPQAPRSGLTGHMRVQVEGGDVLDLRTTMADVLVWERLNDGRSWLLDNTATGILFMAWIAAKRQKLINEGPYVMDQKGWASQVVDYQYVDDEAESALDPTSPAPSES